jgi:hypothetical protein
MAAVEVLHLLELRLGERRLQAKPGGAVDVEPRLAKAREAACHLQDFRSRVRV